MNTPNDDNAAGDESEAERLIAELIGSGHGALLEFEPVERKIKRPDGWTPAMQREFIARLAATGVPGRAARAMTKNLSGVTALYQQPGADSFRAAWDGAVALAEDRRQQERERIAPPDGGWAPPHRRGARPGEADGAGERGEDDDEAADLETNWLMLETLLRKFVMKVQQERSARLAGNVPAADFYLRQITFLEVGFDLMAEGRGLSGWEALGELRRGDHGVLRIAETTMSQVLDGARRKAWEELDEPPRPEHPPRRWLEELTGISIEPLQAYGPASKPPPGIAPEDWERLSNAGKALAVSEIQDLEAAAQLEWESRAQAAPGAAEHGPENAGQAPATAEGSGE